MTTAIRFEDVSKQYRLGEVGTGALSHDLHRAWARLRGKPDPFAKVGQVNDRAAYSNDNGSNKSKFSNSSWYRGKTDASSSYVWALKDISFDVRQGEILGIIGRNGAGKSTLLKLLSRVTAPTTGSIKSKGRIASLLEVGTGFHPELTGRENVFLNGAILGMRREEIISQFDDIVDFSGCAKYIDTPVKRYSSGMTVRLGFAVAAHLNCEILIVDEVLAVGDAEFQEKCLGKMNDVAKSGRTVLFVSHNMTAMSALCSRCIAMSCGTLVNDGPPQSVVGSYLSSASSEKGGVFSLSNHEARKQGMTPIIQKLSILVDGETTEVCRPRDSVTVQLDLDLEKPIKDCRIAVAIEDSLSRRIATYASFFGKNRIDLSGSSKVECVINNLRLGAGRYVLSVSIGTKTDGLLDSIDGAAWFEVQWNNDYGNGESYLPVYGPVLGDSIWREI